MAVDNEAVEMLVLDNDERMEKTVVVLKNDYTTIRAGRANPHILDRVMVDFYGQMTPINQVGNIAVQEGKCLVIAPWDKSLLKNVEKAILQANIGITPTNDGTVVRLVFPALTEERRRELVKSVKKMAEDAKVAVRNIRRDTLEAFKKMKTNKEISEDEFDNYQIDIDEVTSKSIEAIDKASQEKEKDVMTV